MRKVGFNNYQKNTIRKAVSNMRDGQRHPNEFNTNNIVYFDEQSQDQYNYETTEENLNENERSSVVINQQSRTDLKHKTANKSISNIIKVITTENSSPKYVDSRFKRININTLPEIRHNSKKRIKQSKLWINNNQPSQLHVSLQQITEQTDKTFFEQQQQKQNIPQNDDFHEHLGAKNILPYLNKSDILYMRQEEQKIKRIQKVLVEEKSRSRSPRRGQVGIISGQEEVNKDLTQNITQDDIQNLSRSRVTNIKASLDTKITNTNDSNRQSTQKFKEYSSNTQRMNNSKNRTQIWAYQNQNKTNRNVNNSEEHQSLSKNQSITVRDRSNEKQTSLTKDSSLFKIRKPYTKEGLKAEYDKLTQKLENKLMDDKNYKVFYWAPDYSFCGFATSEQVRSTASKWMKDKKLGISERQIIENKSKDSLTSNVSQIPEIMRFLRNTQLDK
ncbi:UNKNOWN [Stylonychia lemnae]|uniref:Uncharacterized protein n=1 Tax=Stylonychia lemnae TaxID=5949 RepID=A0A078AWT3_STYLE|nr:UNKNOWN [Stylonychia lemnae]|eukprot:CDW85717.1 UNKNOWN [Stylonychia lemnae]